MLTPAQEHHVYRGNNLFSGAFIHSTMKKEHYISHINANTMKTSVQTWKKKTLPLKHVKTLHIFFLFFTSTSKQSFFFFFPNYPSTWAIRSVGLISPTQECGLLITACVTCSISVAWNTNNPKGLPALRKIWQLVRGTQPRTPHF